MTKAEQRALEAYPVHKIGDQTSDYGEWDINRIERRSFQEGYEQAEKDLVSELQRRHDGYKIALEKEKDPRSKHAVDLIARIRECSSLITYINSL